MSSIKKKAAMNGNAEAPINKVVVNGNEEAPIKKAKVPRTVDWQKLAKEKQKAEEK